MSASPMKVEADGLSADSSYYYRFLAAEAVSMVGQTKTLPVGDDPGNRRDFLDLTSTPDQAIANFQLLDGKDPLTSAPRWVSETLAASSSFAISPLVTWQSDWRELDLVVGLAVDALGQQTLLDPAAYATAPRDGVQLPDVSVTGSGLVDRIFVAVGSTLLAGAGGDELFNTDSLGGNLLVGE